jgi:hypothetical protein
VLVWPKTDRIAVGVGQSEPDRRLMRVSVVPLAAEWRISSIEPLG